MPKLIKRGQIVDDPWQRVDPDANANATGEHQILSLEQWLQLPEKSGRAVQLEPGQAPSPLFEHLVHSFPTRRSSDHRKSVV